MWRHSAASRKPGSPSLSQSTAARRFLWLCNPSLQEMESNLLACREAECTPSALKAPTHALSPCGKGCKQDSDYHTCLSRHPALVVTGYVEIPIQTRLPRCLGHTASELQARAIFVKASKGLRVFEDRRLRYFSRADEISTKTLQPSACRGQLLRTRNFMRTPYKPHPCLCDLLHVLSHRRLGVRR